MVLGPRTLGRTGERRGAAGHLGLATLFMVLEKLPQIGHRVTRPMGVALIVSGMVVLALPLVNGG